MNVIKLEKKGCVTMPHVKIQMSFIIERPACRFSINILMTHLKFRNVLLKPFKMKLVLVGSYQCTCNSGYKHEYTNDVTSHCIDLNECQDSGSTD